MKTEAEPRRGFNTKELSSEAMLCSATPNGDSIQYSMSPRENCRCNSWTGHLRHLVRSMRATQLLNRFVSTPGQLQGYMHSPLLIAAALRSLERNARGRRRGQNGHTLLACHELSFLGDVDLFAPFYLLAVVDDEAILLAVPSVANETTAAPSHLSDAACTYKDRK